MKALVIRSPWIDLILSGTKTWEMRTKPTSIRGRIALIKAGSGLIYGEAELTDCLPAQSIEQMQQSIRFHGIPESQVMGAIKNNWTTPWVLRNIEKYALPKPYSHPIGAVTWVNIPDEHQTTSVQPKAKVPLPRKAVLAAPSSHKIPKQPSDLPKTVSEWIDIKLTKGNISNGHFYLRSAERLLPSDCIGGSNKSQAGISIRVKFEPGMLTECDIAGDKMILRSRAQVRDFYSQSGASAGDYVRFGRIGHHDFSVTLIRDSQTQS